MKHGHQIPSEADYVQKPEIENLVKEILTSGMYYPGRARQQSCCFFGPVLLIHG